MSEGAEKKNMENTTPNPKKKAFVVSPIGAPGTEVYRNAAYALKYIFKRALDPEQWEVHRADEGMSPDSINQHVIRSLYEADLIIADLTGHNPNVFYELAVAHGIQKPVVHLITKGENLPFDIIDQRTIFYDITDLASVEQTVQTLRQYADAALNNAGELVTPLSNYARFSQIRSTDDGNESNDAVASLLEEIVSRLSRLENRINTNSGDRITNITYRGLDDTLASNTYSIKAGDKIATSLLRENLNTLDTPIKFTFSEDSNEGKASDSE